MLGNLEGDNVAVTVGYLRNGELVPHGTRMTFDPRFFTNKQSAHEVAVHEFGHAGTMNYEPEGSIFREASPEYDTYFLKIGKENPEVKKAMDYNHEIRPIEREDALDEILNDVEAEKHYRNVASD
jgi:hypothetical protein